MQFIANTEIEFTTTILKILDADIYDELAIIYALNIEPDGNVSHVPEKYPCIVSLEIEEADASNRRYMFAAVKFMYPNDLINGYDYQNKLYELANLDIKLENLLNRIETSGTIDKPIVEFEETNKRVTELENILF